MNRKTLVAPAAVASYPGLRFSVEGHTDSVGNVRTNHELSLQWAIAVRDYFIGQAIPPANGI